MEVPEVARHESRTGRAQPCYFACVGISFRWRIRLRRVLGSAAMADEVFLDKQFEKLKDDDIIVSRDWSRHQFILRFDTSYPEELKDFNVMLRAIVFFFSVLISVDIC